MTDCPRCLELSPFTCIDHKHAADQDADARRLRNRALEDADARRLRNRAQEAAALVENIVEDALLVRSQHESRLDALAEERAFVDHALDSVGIPSGTLRERIAALLALPAWTDQPSPSPSPSPSPQGELPSRVPSWDRYFLDFAKVAATRSPCVKRQVGAVLVSADKQLLSTGYNGPPRGAPHRDSTSCVRINIPSGEQTHVVCCAHAETNAIAQAARHGVQVRGSTLYVTTAPCAWCARTIVNAGVVRVVVEGDGIYNDPVAVQVFAESGVVVEPALSRVAAPLVVAGGTGGTGGPTKRRPE